jgi:hypothetical protein
MFHAYVECAFWSSLDYDKTDNPRPLDENYGPDDIAPETWAAMREECALFIEDNAVDLTGIDAGQVGHDFWLTRNGHGAGFWDRGLGDVGARLTDACRPWGGVDLYVGDDGLIHQG